MGQRFIISDRSSTSGTHSSDGFTLLEMLLVLSLIVVMLSLSIPAWKNPLAVERLRKSADKLRVQWAKARLKSMKSGRIQMFRYEIGGGGYTVEPWITDDDLLESNGLSTTLAVSNESSKDQSMPRGIYFLSGERDFDVRADEIEQDPNSNALLGSGSDDETWSRPIMFYPDGTTTTAKVTLANQRGRSIDVTLRGLTGISRSGTIQLTE